MFDLNIKSTFLFFLRPSFLFSSKVSLHWLDSKSCTFIRYFSRHKQSYLGLHNSSITTLQVKEKIVSITKTTIVSHDFWQMCIERGGPEVFETLHNFLSENDLYLSQSIKEILYVTCKVSRHFSVFPSI